MHGDLFTAPTDEGELRQLTEGRSRDLDVQYSPDGKSIAFISDQSGREEIHVIAADGAGPARRVTDLDDLKTVVRLVARQQDDRLRDLRPQALHDRRRRQEPQGAGFVELRRDRQPGLVAGRQADRLLQDRRLAVDRHLPDSQRRRRGEEDHVRPGRARPIRGSRPTAPRCISSAARGTVAARDGRSSQLFCVPLEKLTRDPDEADQRPDGSAAESGPEARRGGDGPGGHAQDTRTSTGPG